MYAGKMEWKRSSLEEENEKRREETTRGEGDLPSCRAQQIELLSSLPPTPPSNQRTSNALQRKDSRTHPNKTRFIKLFGFNFPGVPIKVTNLTPPHSSPPLPFSQARTSFQAFSLTAL